ncbi:MAG: hypothetical protein HUJ77_07710 [Clostridium sp.]|uniref:hypothetical protein n=1 Tax=Clostridium sp. TaxID=1506 RepID=UPI0025C1AA05|nr:hypothetical protein [Clostridium sp.]MCF0148269.1 hypothetical protein [Clostridium sp.]
MKKISLIIYYSIQYFIIGISFIAFTSTMEIMPWYEPLTMGAFFILMIITPIQLLIFIITFLLKEKLLIKKRVAIVSHIHSLILVSIFIITMLNEPLFYPLSVVFSVLEVLLGLYLFISIVR